MLTSRIAFAAVLSLAVAPAAAENSKPQPTPVPHDVPDARDIPYPGMMTLDIDATDVARRIFRVRQTIPVAKSGEMVLLYPQWLPGTHAPRGEIDKLVGLTIRANGRVLPWRRDPVEVYAIHVDVPTGAKALDCAFAFASATKADQGRIVMTQNLISLQWNSMSLYPAGYFTRQVPVKATVRYPEGWTAYAAVPARHEGATYRYDATNYEVLVDSPVIAGRYAKTWALSPRVHLDVVADSPAELAATPAQIAAHQRLVEQAVKNFGAQHYDDYHFLFSISAELGGNGLEHHRSSEDGVGLGYFTKWDEQAPTRNLLPHEYSHSWDGKFRRGADLWTPDFRTPMRDSLLWVYEGQTQFWGYVLQARSGLVSKQDTLDAYASIAANLDTAPGRRWRPLIDTTNDPVISARRPKGWVSEQRSEDYYNEGLLVWMEVDSILREQSHGTKSIDDFARAFFGINDGDWGEVTYTFDDVVATLERVQPYDWRGLLTRRLTETADHAPLTGFERNGYRLVYTDKQTGWARANERNRKITDLTYSIGLTTNATGDISGVLWEGPAFKAGATAGMTVVSVNGQTYSDEKLKAAIVAAKDSAEPVRLLVKSQETVLPLAIDYHGGLRYPHLEKTGPGEAGLDRLLAAR